MVPVQNMFAASVADICVPGINELRTLISVATVDSRCPLLLDMLAAAIVAETPARIKLIDYLWHTPYRPPPGSLSSWDLWILPALSVKLCTGRQRAVAVAQMINMCLKAAAKKVQ
jgi:hypothetical protein